MKLLRLNTFSQFNGSLSVLEDFQIPFVIKRFFYIYKVDDSYRGGHRHKTTFQAAICLKGSCKIYNNNGAGLREIITLDTPDKCLLLEPRDWHVMFDFTGDAILLVATSTNFDEKDYIYEPYNGETFIHYLENEYQQSVG